MRAFRERQNNRISSNDAPETRFEGLVRLCENTLGAVVMVLPYQARKTEAETSEPDPHVRDRPGPGRRCASEDEGRASTLGST